MLIVAIVGVVFAALAVCGVWLDIQDPRELREMGIQLEYEPGDRDQITEPSARVGTKRRRPTRSKRTSRDHPHPAHLVHHV